MIRASSPLSRRLDGFTVALAITLVGAGWEIYQWAGARPLWLDEEMIALNLRDRTLLDLTGTLWLAQSAPFGWLALQRLVVVLLGTSDLALRLVPTIFGVATLVVALWIGRRWLNPVGAAVLALLCSFGEWFSFYSLELKQYSADMFFALLLPALMVWATEDPPDRELRRWPRVAIWWVVAALGQWFANGALLVTPACAVTLFVVVWRRQGVRRALAACLPAVVWVVSFGLHYVTTLRYTLGSDNVRGYWEFALPPQSGGLTATLEWLAAALVSFAVKPGGGTGWIAFWLAYVAGVALVTRARVALGLVVGFIPLSGLAFAAVRVVPLYERLSLWMVPALYVAIAGAADQGLTLAFASSSRRRWSAAVAAALAALVGLDVSGEIAWRGLDKLRYGRNSATNHELNDRRAVSWLVSQRQPNDDLMATHLGLPALWWYGGVPISGPDKGATFDGGRVLDVSHLFPGPGCRTKTLSDALRGRSRVLVYLGFRFDDVPKGFDDRLVSDLKRLGALIGDRRFGPHSRVIIVDLREPPTLRTTTAETDGQASVRGCLPVAPAVRW